MKKNILIISVFAIGLSGLPYGCSNRQAQEDFVGGVVLVDTTAVQHIDSSDTDAYTLANLTDVRRPDMRKHVRKGCALLLETDGFQLAAIDTAVLHSGTYSVTSLRADDLAALPQGMKNMTSSAAGYRLLPGGEHFSPYAELRVAYNPDLLPEGYTPDDIYTSFYDTVSLSWVRLERVGVDTISHEIVSLTSHFTDFINELLKAPEMPETQAFVPTAMSDLEAVSPMDGLPIIQPPAANNNGTANVNYPIVIPAGRGGMQPNLTLAYSSSGANGWLGVGWDISVPSITLDTRWGVPRYNSDKETEIYLLDGEQLITRESDGTPRPLPHRTNQQTGRLRDSTQFYARTGDAHDSIIRHGDGPMTYWWEVVDRNGITHYYGHYPDSTQNANNPSTLGGKGIAKWMLCESRDLYGNWVRYFYDTVMTNGVNPGIQIYLDSISYTGHGSDNGVYSVIFTRKDRSLDDRPVNCIFGYKEETTQQLCNIAVKTADTIIWGYYFETECGYASNFKTRLLAVNKIDNLLNFAGAREILNNVCTDGISEAKCGVARQEFEYFDYPALGAMFDGVKSSTVSTDGLKGFMLTPSFRIDSVNAATAFGLSHSSNWSIGGSLGVGLDPVVCMSSTSVGGNYQRGKSSSESIMTLIDIDGDGLSDKVFVKNGQLHWRKQLPPVDGNIAFDTAHTIDSVSHFLVEGGVTNTFGAQASVAAASGSGSWSTSVSTTPTYFADVNGDGLIDIVDNGQVWFNRVVNGQPKFTKYRSQLTIGDDTVLTDAPLTDSHGCTDIIFDGEVDEQVAFTSNWDTCEVSGTLDSATVFQLCENYISNDSNTVLPVRDSNGYHIAHMCIRRDPLSRNLSMAGVPGTEAVRVWVAPDSGEVTLRSYVRLMEDTSFSRGQSRHADGVTYTIQHSHGIIHLGNVLLSAFDTILMSRYICPTCYRQDDFSGNNYDSIYTFNVNAGDILFFRLQSNDDKQFDNIEDYISISFGDYVYQTEYGFVLTDDKYFQAPYNGQYIIDGEYTNQEPLVSLNVCQPSGATPNGSGALDWSGNIEKDSVIHISLNTNSEYADWSKVEMRARIRYWSDSLPDTITVWTSGDKRVVHPAGSVWGNYRYKRLFGSLYDGWGQFAYHPIGASANNPLIILGTLTPPAYMLAKNVSDTAGLEGKINGAVPDSGFNQPTPDEFTEQYGSQYVIINDSSCWVEMLPDAEHNRWVAFGAQNSIGKDVMSNSLQEQWYSSVPKTSTDSSAFLPPASAYDDAIPISTDHTPVKGVRKVNRSENQSYTYGASYSYSNGSSNIEMDYIDLNGDRYPDIVGTSGVQYRSQWGGLGQATYFPMGITNVTASLTHSAGYSFGASPVSHKRSMSGIPAKAKFSLSGDGSFGGDISLGWNHSASSWTDINGDGLPDFVSEGGDVRLNVGYTFLDAEDWAFDSVNSGQSASVSVNFGVSGSLSKFNVVQGSIQLGAGLSRSANRTGYTFVDINGDGLPDMVWRDNVNVSNLANVLNPIDYVHVKLNLGSGRWSQIYDLNIKNFNLSESYNESLNAGVTVGTTFFGTFKVTAGINGTPYSSNVSRDCMQLVDINGDGFPDLVISDRENNIRVRYNKGGKTNLLKKITNFTGSRIYLDYVLSEPCYEQPSRSWNLSMVKTMDTLNPNGGDTSETRFSYQNPYYERLERTSYGYGLVVTEQINPTDSSVYRTVCREYFNNNILVKGRPKRELTKSGDGHKYVEKEYQYAFASYDGGDVDSCLGDAYTLYDRIVTRFYEGADDEKLTTAEKYEYDKYHNVTVYIDEGDTAYVDDGLYVEMSYLQNQPHNLVALRSEYKVYATGDSGANWMRRASFSYDTAGKLLQQTLFDSTGSSSYDLEYDNYGNIFKAMRPLNDSNQRMTYRYTYDNYTQTYPVKIKNSFNDSVESIYLLYFGKPLAVTDPTGNTMRYSYDFSGRLSSVTSPLNISSSPSLENQYYPINYYQPGSFPSNYIPGANSHPYSITKHFDDNGFLITETVVVTDGFGRVIQTKKGQSVGGVKKMQVSGRAFVDAFGRTIVQYDPFACPYSTSTLGQFEPYYNPSSFDSTKYDVLDRVTRTVQPLNTKTVSYYDITDDTTGRRRFYTKITDPNGNITHQFADYEKRQVQITTDGDNGTTLLQYDNLGQLIQSTDPEGFATSYGYDRLGRVTYRFHPDAGITRFEYDPAGNITRETNPLGQISYTYSYSRMTHKHYNYMQGNDVSYIYGTSGNETGRPVLIVDGSGSYACLYDGLGNVKEETRTIAMPNNLEVYRFHTKYTYDSWGRILDMIYPDGEKVSYSYLWGGDLFSMKGIKNNIPQPYIDSIYYNCFGQRDSVQYGNGTRAQYQYDALHRLAHLTSYQSNGAIMQDIAYTFDSASNITHIFDNTLPIGTLGGGYENWYNYDELHRLVSSTGDNVLGHYDYSMDYTSSGRIKKKNRDVPSGSLSLPVLMFYSYCNDDKPHAVRRIYDKHNRKNYDFRWDAAGNLGQISIANDGSIFETGRFLFWTEDSRMHAAVDDRYYSYYAYDYGGERRLKLTGNNNVLDVNAKTMATYATLTTPTLYPSAYLVLSNHGYTKHYYAGTERVAARIGGGGLDVIEEDPELSRTAWSVFRQSLKQINNRYLERNNIECINNGLLTQEEPCHDIEEMPDFLNAEANVDYDVFWSMINGIQEILHNEPDVYFYHSDHLGSASWITDNNGFAVQHLQYLPYGERFLDQRTTGYHERFTFTGKERDGETGYGYFGARYMDHELMTMWLSVDPMADKYPSISPYAYCVWNPIKLVDPNGEDIYRLDTETGSLTLYRRTKDNKDIIEAGTTTGIGRAKQFKTSSTKEFSKGILNGRDGQDFSQTGFVTCGNLQEEAIDVAVFISFSCNKEVSGVGYDGIIGNHDVEVFAWSNNTCNNSDNPPSFIPSLGGKSTFHFHTHCGNKKGEYGSATPSVADKYAASSMRSAYGIDTFVIISKKEGSILYGENGRVSPYVGHLPTSVYFNY